MQSMRLALVVALGAGVAGLENGLGLTPPMGYNTWNDLRCKQVSAPNIKLIADAMVSSGLHEAGYDYLNVDDCWAKSRDPITHRIIPDSIAFPDGIQDVIAYVHSKGLKFGLYTDRGTYTCEGRPGSYSYEEIDAQTYAEWGVDYLKEDSCNAPAPDTHEQALSQYAIMRDALKRTGRPIYFSLCGWAYWYAFSGAGLGNSWRVAVDINTWETLFNAVSVNSQLSEYARPGAWNDPDMLLGSSAGSAVHLTPSQSRTQFSLWAIMAAPLLLGTRLLSLSSFDRDTYTNREVIAVNQDRLGMQGVVMWEDCPKFSLEQLHEAGKKAVFPVPDCRQIWARQLENRAYAVCIVNWGSTGVWTDVSVGPVLMQRMGFYAGASVRSLWEKKELGVQTVLQDRVFGDGSAKLYRFSPPSEVPRPQFT